jgi:phosphatidylglycerophosphatase A
MPRAALGTAAALAAVGGWVAVQRLPDGPADPGWIVVDEFAGQWVAMLGARRGSVVDAAAAFALFRLFDGYKLGPVGWADRSGGMVGVMLDDLVAGAIAAGLLASVRRATPRWRLWRW